MLVTLPARVNDQARNKSADKVEAPVFSTIEDIIAFGNQVKGEASVGASVGAQASDSKSFVDFENLTVGARVGARVGALNIINGQVHTEVSTLLNGVTKWTRRIDLFKAVGLTNRSSNRKKYLDPLFDFGWVEIEFPDNITHPNQRYKITVAGKRILDLIKG